MSKSNVIAKDPFILLVIPYNYAAETTDIAIVSVKSKEAANAYVSTYLKERESPSNKGGTESYFILIAGTVIPTNEWVAEQSFTHHD